MFKFEKAEHRQWRGFCQSATPIALAGVGVDDFLGQGILCTFQNENSGKVLAKV